MSQAALVSLNSDSLEDALLMRAWGWWARPRIHQELGARSPGWACQMQTGYRESTMHLAIEETYAMKLDGLIAKLPENNKQVLVNLYVYNLPLEKMQDIVRRSKHIIRQERDAALSFLWGQLVERA